MAARRVNEIYNHAIKLLSARDYTVAKLREKLASRFGDVPQEIIDRLVRQKFLNDRRFAENYAGNRSHRGRVLLREELLVRGIPTALADEILSKMAWPSLREALTAKMNDCNLHSPLQLRDATRLFRALQRLGYDEDAIREEIEKLHEQ